MEIERAVPSVAFDGALVGSTGGGLREVYAEIPGGGEKRAVEFEFESDEELRGVAEGAEFETGVPE